MRVYQTDKNGYYAGFSWVLNETDICPKTGQYLIPAGCVVDEPPEAEKGIVHFWDGFKWQQVVGPIFEPLPCERPAERLTSGAMRAKRNALLAASDWTQLPDVPLSKEKKADWKRYRKELRDLPASEHWPDCDFPLPPL